MSILLDKDTRVIVQGITGKMAGNSAEYISRYDPKSEQERRTALTAIYEKLKATDRSK